MDIRIKVETGVKKESVCALPDGRFLVSVRAKPKSGAANARVCELIAERFDVSVENIRVVRGKSSPTKVVTVREARFLKRNSDTKK